MKRVLVWVAAAFLLAASIGATAYSENEFSVSPTPTPVPSASTFSVQTQTSGTQPQTSAGGRRIEYGQLQTLVTSNLEVIKSRNSYNSTLSGIVETDESLQEAIDSYDETAEKFNTMKIQLKEQYDAGLMTEEAYEEQLDAVYAQEESALNALDSQIEALEKAKNASTYQQETASLRIVSTVRAQTDAAQSAFLNYYSLNQKLLVAQNQLEYLEWQESLAATKLAKNLISQDTYNKAFDAIRPQRDSIDAIVTSLRKNELTLKTAIGLQLAQSIDYGPLPALDIASIPLCNRESDRATYVSRSVDIQNAVSAARKANYDLYNDDVNGFDRDNANLTYEQAVENANREFEASYDALQDGYKSYQNAVKAHEDKLTELSKLRIKLEKGVASKNAVRIQEYTVYQSERNLKATEIDLFSQFQQYRNGLSL